LKISLLFWTKIFFMRKRAFGQPFKNHRKTLAIIILLIMTGSLQSVWAQGISHIRIIKKEIHSPGDIVPVNDSLVIPYVYTNKISLNHLPVPEKKQKFFDMLLPSVLIAKTHLDMTREHVEILARKKVLTRTDWPRQPLKADGEVHGFSYRETIFSACGRSIPTKTEWQPLPTVTERRFTCKNSIT